MTWNHRFVEIDHGDGITTIELFEVYYDDEGRPISRTENPATIGGDTKMEAWDALALAGRAIGKPVLKDSEIGVGHEDLAE